MHRRHRREQPPDPPHPELREPEVPLALRLEDQARDQEARDHEEHVDADVTTAESKARVEHHDREHGDGAQAVDFGAVGGRLHPVAVKPQARSRRRALEPA
jgi:hypothetical protein